MKDGEEGAAAKRIVGGGGGNTVVGWREAVLEEAPGEKERRWPLTSFRVGFLS